VVARFHPHRLLRVDASLWLAVTSEKFYEERLATVAVAVAAPLSVWIDPGRVGYLGLTQNLPRDFATRYTSGVTRFAAALTLTSTF
jgi:hypothetical protein